LTVAIKCLSLGTASNLLLIAQLTLLTTTKYINQQIPGNGNQFDPTDSCSVVLSTLKQHCFGKPTNNALCYRTSAMD